MATIGKTNPHARRLRRDSTEAEGRLWSRLRNRQVGGFKFKRQETIGPFVVDFACIECRLIVEADGGQHGGDDDVARTAYLKQLGWRVLRFWNNEILTNTYGTLETILLACDDQKDKPYPLPPAGEGV